VLAPLMRILVVNTGSSSLKLRLLDADDSTLINLDMRAQDGFFDKDELRSAVEQIVDQVDAVGHRIVHGGTSFAGATVIDGQVEEELRKLSDLAPLHQMRSLSALDLVGELLPHVPTVACFDTAFHSTLPAAAFTYPIPAEWRELGARRYGFHGLSHCYASRRAKQMIGELGHSSRMITCHLGAGASLAAVLDGVSVDTTMGFTPLEGLMMATRSGTVDPGLLMWLVSDKGNRSEDVAEMLEHQSGLLAIAGSADMSQVIAAADRGEEAAILAVAMYVHRLRAGIASMASALNGLDALVFTGGVGENAPGIRAAAADGLSFLGVAIDEEINARAEPDTVITRDEAGVSVLVITAREDLQIAREVRSLLA